jgi:hypothetical protein
MEIISSGGVGKGKFFGGSDNDIMEVGSDADQFNCGDGMDTVLERCHLVISLQVIVKL